MIVDDEYLHGGLPPGSRVRFSIRARRESTGRIGSPKLSKDAGRGARIRAAAWRAALQPGPPNIDLFCSAITRYSVRSRVSTTEAW
jgi:hypothetical protein